MKLTSKDKEFLDRLRALWLEKNLAVELRGHSLKRMVLLRNYGDRIESHFGMTRQGVRWRFNRLFNDIYTEAYCTILWLESSFGTGLREFAMAIARQRVGEYRKAQKVATGQAPRRQKASAGAGSQGLELTRDLPS